MPTATHHWLHGDRRAGRERVLAGLDLPPLLCPVVDAHRRLRGPYTAGGTLLRALVPDLLVARPELVSAHDVEILTITPELRGMVPASRETLTSLAVPDERTRFYSRLRTLRIAHGVVEFLRDSTATPATLVVENLHQADPTDQELVAVLLRRLDPERLTVVVGTGTGPLPDPLGAALTRHATRHDAHAVEESTMDDPVERYFAGDGTSDEPAVLAAYEALDPAERARRHDERAAVLESRDEWSLRLGAIPYHREHGSDPAQAGGTALQVGLDYCINMGFYDATVDFGRRGRAVIEWYEQGELWWTFTTKMTTSLAALSRPEEAEELYVESRARTVDASVHRQASYALAMLYTRHHVPERRDDRIAKGWINAAIAMSAQLADPKERAFNIVFNQNGRALVEVHLGNLPEALRLVDDGLARLDRELEPGEHLLHRSVLRYNRAQVYAGLGRLKEAVADYTAVIAEDPNYAEYYFDRGSLLRRLGQNSEALADYEQAMRLSPPYPEVYYNRADLRAEWGDVDGALADFDYVIELEPEYVDAYANRAGLLCELGRLDEARRDVAAGLAIDPQHAHLHCVRGQVAVEDGAPELAWRAFTEAIEHDPALAVAWANRGTVAFDQGDHEGALADLTEAVRLGDSAEVRFNRAVCLGALGRYDEAVDDLTTALDLGADPVETRQQRGAYLRSAGRSDRARQDEEWCAQAG